MGFISLLTVEECKAKWKNMRGCLTRYVRHLKITKGTPAKAIKPYYLYDALKFLIPFTKTKNTSSDVLKNTSPDFLKESALKEESSEFYDRTDSPEPATKKIHIELPESDPLEEPTRVMYIPSGPGEEENADLNFFKSILPDIAVFTPHQKRKFKQRLLQIIDDIASSGN